MSESKRRDPAPKSVPSTADRPSAPPSRTSRSSRDVSPPGPADAEPQTARHAIRGGGGPPRDVVARSADGKRARRLAKKLVAEKEREEERLARACRIVQIPGLFRSCDQFFTERHVATEIDFIEIWGGNWKESDDSRFERSGLDWKTDKERFRAANNEATQIWVNALWRPARSAFRGLLQPDAIANIAPSDPFHLLLHDTLCAFLAEPDESAAISATTAAVASLREELGRHRFAFTGYFYWLARELECLPCVREASSVVSVARDLKMSTRANVSVLASRVDAPNSQDPRTIGEAGDWLGTTNVVISILGLGCPRWLGALKPKLPVPLWAAPRCRSLYRVKEIIDAIKVLSPEVAAGGTPIDDRAIPRHQLRNLRPPGWKPPWGGRARKRE